VAIANDALAIIDRANPTQILVLDTTSGTTHFKHFCHTTVTPLLHDRDNVLNTLIQFNEIFAIANDALAIIDRANPTQIFVLDTTSGTAHFKTLETPLWHTLLMTSHYTSNAGKPMSDPIEHDCHNIVTPL
jgi:hypothetical protein